MNLPGRQPIPDADLAFLARGGEMGERIRSFDWSGTSLRAPASWPQSLRSAISILLPSRAQIVLFWGPELLTFYNDAYRPVLGAKHPRVLGLPVWETWSELWEVGLNKLIMGVVETGDAYWGTDVPFIMQRYGYPEETYFDVSYDPVRVESGAVGGVFCIVTETTERVVGQRRMALLRDLAAQNAMARTARDACVLAMEVLSAKSADITFALAYLDDELQAATPGAEQRLAGASIDHVKTLTLPSSSAGGRAGRFGAALSLREWSSERRIHYKAD